MDMPTRTAKQQVEDLSIVALKNALPREWVYREKDRDYGLDGEIEVFDKNGYATGIVFWVQLKATDSKEESRQKRVQLKITSINYFFAQELPILIVRYSEDAKQLYFRWAHELDNHNFKDQKTFSFLMTESDKWNKDTPDHLVGTIQKYTALKRKSNMLPLNIYLDFSLSECCGTDTRKLVSSFRKKLESKPKLINIIDQENYSDAKIELTKNKLSVYFIGISGCHFTGMNTSSSTCIDDVLNGMFSALSIALMHFDKNEDALSILNNFIENFIFIQEPSIALGFIAEFLKRGDTENANKLWMAIPNKLKNNEVRQDFHLLLSALSVAMGYDLSTTTDKFLFDEIEVHKASGELKNVSGAYYNYANHFRHKGEFIKSLSYYNKALKSSSYFCESDYFFKELAGMLFLMRRYTISIKLYDYGLSLKKDPKSQALYADALMMKGEYLLSLNAFENYLKICADASPLWVLKYEVLSHIIKELGIESQKRSYSLAMQTQEIKKLNTGVIKRDELLSVLQIDAISPLAWFNLAADYAKSKEFDLATTGYLVSAFVNNEDIEAWSRAFITSIFEKRIERAFSILYSGIMECGEDMLEPIYKFIDQKMAFSDKSERDEFNNHIDSIVKEARKKRDQKEIVLNGMGIKI